MNSLIVWLLIVNPYGAYCMSALSVTFKTEIECINAMQSINNSAYRISCEPKAIKVKSAKSK